jgi:hypothetical protein
MERVLKLTDFTTKEKCKRLVIEKLLNMPKNQHRPYTDVLLVTYLPTDFFVSVAKSIQIFTLQKI